jgi:hypothetical protein
MNQELSMKLDYPLFFQELGNIGINIISISLTQSSRKRKEPKSIEVVPREGTGLTGGNPKSQLSFFRINWNKRVS